MPPCSMIWRPRSQSLHPKIPAQKIAGFTESNWDSKIRQSTYFLTGFLYSYFFVWIRWFESSYFLPGYPGILLCESSYFADWIQVFFNWIQFVQSSYFAKIAGLNPAIFYLDSFWIIAGFVLNNSWIRFENSWIKPSYFAKIAGFVLKNTWIQYFCPSPSSFGSALLTGALVCKNNLRAKHAFANTNAKFACAHISQTNAFERLRIFFSFQNRSVACQAKNAWGVRSVSKTLY